MYICNWVHTANPCNRLRARTVIPRGCMEIQKKNFNWLCSFTQKHFNWSACKKYSRYPVGVRAAWRGAAINASDWLTQKSYKPDRRIDGLER